MYDSYIENKPLYAKYNKPAPFFVDNTQHAADGTGVVVVIPFNDPTNTLVVPTLADSHYRFKNVDGNAVINQIVNDEGKVILQTDSNGTFNNDDIDKAVKNETLSKNSATSLFGASNVAKIVNNSPTTTISFPSDYSQGDWDADIASGKIPKGSIFTGYDTKTGQVSYTSFPASYSQDDWDADIASGKIQKGSTFVNYDPKTGQVNYSTPGTTSTTTTNTGKGSSLLSVIKSLINPNYTQAELQQMYENYKAPTIKDVENAIKTLGDPRNVTNIGAKVSALSSLWNAFTSTNPVAKFKNGHYAYIAKGIAEASDNAVSQAADITETATDWDRVMDTVQNEAVESREADMRASAESVAKDVAYEQNYGQAATLAKIQANTIVMTPILAKASQVATVSYANAIALGASSEEASAYSTVVTANAITNGNVSSLQPINQLTVNSQQQTVIQQATGIAATLNQGIQSTSLQMQATNPTITSAQATQLITKAITTNTPINQWAIDPDTGAVVEANTAETIRQQQGVSRNLPQVEELPSWLDNDEFERLKKKGLTTEQIYQILRQSGGSRQTFEWLVNEAVRIIQKNKSQSDALEKAIQEERSKRPRPRLQLSRCPPLRGKRRALPH